MGNMGASAKGVAVLAGIAATTYFSHSIYEESVTTQIEADKTVVTSDGMVFLRDHKKKLGFLAGIILVGTVLYVMCTKKKT